MNERVEAAASAMWDQRPMIRLEDGSPKPFSQVRTQYPYRDRYTRQAEVALAAADAVMLSDEAIVGCFEVVDDFTETFFGDFVAESDKANFVRAVLAALKGAGDE